MLTSQLVSSSDCHLDLSNSTNLKIVRQRILFIIERSVSLNSRLMHVSLSSIINVGLTDFQSKKVQKNALSLKLLRQNAKSIKILMSYQKCHLC